MAEFIASYIALPITIVIAVSVVIYLLVQSWAGSNNEQRGKENG